MKTLTFKQISASVLLLVLVATIAGLFLETQRAYGSTSFNGSPSLFFSVATSSAALAGTSSTLVIATSTGRTFLRIANTGGIAVTCIYNNGGPATVSNGFIIAASSTFEMNQLNEPVYTGTVQCISDTGSSEKLYVEANQ